MARLRAVSKYDTQLSELLVTVPEVEVSCRAGTHRFATDRLPPEQLVSRIAVTPVQRGLKVEDPCMDGCGVRLVLMLGSRGYLDAETPRRLDYPKGWVSVPRYLPHGKRVFRAERYKRHADSFAAVILAAARQGRDIPQTRFAGA
jgi:hypothetical protein